METNDTRALNERVGERLRFVRELKGITPEQAAEATEKAVSPSYIRRVEKGENSPSIEVLNALCIAYGTSLGKFFMALEEGDRRRTA